MTTSLLSITLARWQFGLSASFHFLFVPLTLGLSWLLFIMESAYLYTGNIIYKDMTRFWGKLFGINFALGILTGLSLEFQFGTNWAYYSQYVGDVFGTPLAIEGLVAFMLESTFLGLFFFGWDKLSRTWHWITTFFLAIGSSLSAMLILIANGFMQHPAGAHFNFETVRMETGSLWQLILNPIAQIGFIHTLISGYLTAAIFVLGISAYYLLKKRNIAFAKRSFAIAAGFGFIASIMVIFMGDQNGLVVAKTQPMKLAAIEAEWVTHTPPAAFNILALPDQKAHKNRIAIQIPKILGIMITHTLNQPVPGISTLMEENQQRIHRGIKAYTLLQTLQQGNTSPEIVREFNKYKADLGFGLLVKRYTENPAFATSAQIQQAVLSTVPEVSSLFWTFRIMVAIGFFSFFLLAFAFIKTLRHSLSPKNTLFLRICLYSIPLPWIASTCGWFVTEHGRQPWTIYNTLPTYLSASGLPAFDVALSLGTFLIFFIALLAIELKLMCKYARLGPSALKTGRYS